MNLLRNIIIFMFLATFAATACDEVREYPWNPDWDQYQPEPEPEPEPGPAPGDTTTTEKPDTTQTPEPPVVDPEPKPEVVGKARLVWIDAAANFKDYANDQDRIAQDMARLKETGFTAVVVDVRPTNSGVLFNSSTEGALTKVDAWVNGGYVWLERTADFDYLQAFIDAGEEVGLDV